MEEGIAVKDRLAVWVKGSKAIFENKLALLEAEHHASICQVTLAAESYDLAIKVARDNGYVHEQGLAHGQYIFG